MKYKRKLKVLLAAPLPPPDHGGIGNWTRIVKERIGPRDDVELILIDTNVRYRSATNNSFPVRLIGGSLQALRDTFRVYIALRKKRPDVFHLTSTCGLATPKDNMMLRLARRFGVPSAIHYRMGRMPDLAARQCLEWKMILRTMRLATKVIALGPRTFNTASQALPPGHALLLPNMVEIDLIDEVLQKALLTSCKNSMELIFVGQVLPTKGLRELIQACSQLPKLSFKLTIVGPVSSDFKTELLALASANGKPTWLEMTGPVPHPIAMERMAQADVVVLPSYTEGMPNVILEAMAMSKPIVATPVGAIPSMLLFDTPDECGVSVPPQEVDSLREVLSNIILDVAPYREMAKKARRRAEIEYDVTVGCDRLVNLWRELASMPLVEQA